MNGKIIKVSDSLVLAEGLGDANIRDLVRVGKQRLFGEVISMEGDCAAVSVYEDAVGLSLGEAVSAEGAPLTVELGPGLLGGCLDAIGRPFSEIRRMAGNALSGGVDAPALSRARLWEFAPAVQAGDVVSVGDVIGTVREAAVVHRIMVPAGFGGTIVSIQEGSFSVTDTICLIRGNDGQNQTLTLAQRAPVRVPRPHGKRYMAEQSLSGGSSIIDTLFPLQKGGKAAAVGVSGSGKSELMRQLAQMPEADVVVFVCCGVRGSELTELTRELGQAKDLRTGEPLLNRAVVIANTADMPAAGCDAAINTGCAVAEYFRDMGYDALLLVDCVSRWAESVRDVGRLLGETPCDDGYPAYMASRIAGIYERAGVVDCLGVGVGRGSLTMVGTVSDTKGAVLQAVERVVRSPWRMDTALERAKKLREERFGSIEPSDEENAAGGESGD